MREGGEGTDQPTTVSPGDGSGVSEPSPPGAQVERWVAALRAALATVLDDDEFDITTGAEPGVLEVAADDWTLRIEGLRDDPSSAPSSSAKRPTAWVAIDDEPDAPARYRAARRAVMSPALDRALAEADAAMNGALRSALEAGQDPFSQDLVDALPSP